MYRRVAGEAVGTEEQAAVTITGVSQAAFPDHNVQYQFRTENNGGQVSSALLLWFPSFFAFQYLETAGVKIPTLLVLRQQVTYRVVQVTDDQLEASADGSGAVSVVSTAAFAGTPQAVAQVSKQDGGTAGRCWWWRRK